MSHESSPTSPTPLPLRELPGSFLFRDRCSTKPSVSRPFRLRAAPLKQTRERFRLPAGPIDATLGPLWRKLRVAMCQTDFRLCRQSIRGDGADAVVVAVLPSSPHITGGVDRARGDREGQESRRRSRPAHRQGLSGTGITPSKQFRLDDATLSALSALAAKSGLDQNEVVRRLIRHPRAADLLEE